ncbi:MAG: hypothetical protein GY719_10290 [bacterium]|nr:hypothetical protein [bacterium]
MHPKPEITEHLELMENVPVGGNGRPATAGDGALVFTIHDGDKFPRHLFGERTEEVLARPEIETAHLRERDWGANLVARHLAREIGTGSYLRLNLARVVMDFGRFPGTSSVGEEYLRRHALFPPLEHLFDEDARHEILARYYDGAALAFTQYFSRPRVTIAIHSYDPHNQSGTRRPEVSLVTRSLEYQLQSTMPPYIFDPLFPPELCEATCQQLLTYRALAALESDGWHTALNYPYIMPEGSVEIRAQVWLYFGYLRREFTRAFPHTRDLPGYQRVWQLLLDVIRRSPAAERLRGYLHRYRSAPRDSRELFAEARRAYGEIARFAEACRDDLLRGFRFGSERLSCLGIEVRKDLLCEIDRTTRVVRPRADAERTARRIAACIAPAVRAHLAEHAPAEAARDSLTAEDAGRLVPTVMA